MKKVIALGLSLLMLAGLSACASSQPEASTEPSAQVTTLPSTQEQSQPSSQEQTEPSTQEQVPTTTQPTQPTDDPAKPQPEQWIEEKDGNTVTRSLYTDGVLVTKEVTVKDDRDTPFWRQTFTFTGEEELEGYTSEVLDSNGRTLKIFAYAGGYLGEDFLSGGEEQWYRSYQYDQDGKVVEEEYAISNGQPLSREFWLYNSAGQLVAKFDACEGLSYEAEYDAQGRILHEYNYMGPECDSTDYTYNADGSYTVHYIGATYGSSDSKYDADGKRTELIVWGDGNAEYSSTFRYNANGDVEEELCEDSVEGLVRYTYVYTYSDHGWISRECYADGVIDHTATRVYNADGTLASEEVRNYVTSYTYDAQGRVFEVTFTYEGE